MNIFSSFQLFATCDQKFHLALFFAFFCSKPGLWYCLNVVTFVNLAPAVMNIWLEWSTWFRDTFFKYGAYQLNIRIFWGGKVLMQVCHMNFYDSLLHLEYVSSLVGMSQRAYSANPLALRSRSWVYKSALWVGLFLKTLSLCDVFPVFM